MNKSTIEKAIYAYLIIVTLIFVILMGITIPLSTKLLGIIVNIGFVESYIFPFFHFFCGVIITFAVLSIIPTLVKCYTQYTMYGKVEKYITPKYLPFRHIFGEPRNIIQLLSLWGCQILVLIILYIMSPLLVYIPQLLIGGVYIYALTKPRKVLKGFANITRMVDNDN